MTAALNTFLSGFVSKPDARDALGEKEGADERELDIVDIIEL